MPNISIDLSSAVNQLLEEYGDGVQDTINKVLKDVGKEAVGVIQAKSSKHNHTGRYMKGWRAEVVNEGYGINTVIVHNKTDWNLTHLLNNGFESVRHHKHIAGDGHIDDAEKEINDILIKKVEGSL